MSKTLKLNGGTIAPVDTIRLVKPLTDEARAKAGDKLGIDASRFQARVEFADKSSKLVADSIDDLKAQGVGFVNVGGDRYVPAANIKTAEAFSKAEADALKEKGFNLSTTFRSRVETTAGQVLSQATPDQVMQRRAKALDLAAQTPGAGQGAPAAPAAK